MINSNVNRVTLVLKNNRNSEVLFHSFLHNLLVSKSEKGKRKKGKKTEKQKTQKKSNKQTAI